MSWMGVSMRLVGTVWLVVAAAQHATYAAVIALWFLIVSYDDQIAAALSARRVTKVLVRESASHNEVRHDG